MLANELFQLRDDPGVSPSAEVGADSGLEHCQALLIQTPAHVVCETLFVQLEQGRPPSEVKRLVGTAFPRKLLERRQVEFARFDA
jgi:hypothetical protein